MNLTVLAAVVWCWLAFGYLYAIFTFITDKKLRSEIEKDPVQSLCSLMVVSLPAVVIHLIIPLLILFLLRITGFIQRKDKD